MSDHDEEATRRLVLDLPEDLFERVQAKADGVGLHPRHVAEHAIRELFGMVPA